MSRIDDTRYTSLPSFPMATVLCYRNLGWYKETESYDLFNLSQESPSPEGKKEYK